MSLGSLGSSRRRRAGTNGVLGGALGKLTSPTEWTIASGEWPSTVSYAMVNSWTRWNELAYPGSGLTASSTTITPWKVGQVLELPPAWRPNAPVAAPAPAAALVAAAPSASGPDLMMQMQRALNVWLSSIGYAPVPVSGAWDGPTCGAAIQMDRTVANTDPRKVAVANLLVQIQPILGMPCGTTVSPVAPAPPVVAVAPPAAQYTAPSASGRSASLPPLNRDGECVINFGQRSSEIGLIQSQLNDVLAQNGYTPIPVSQVWDAATCGAMFELGGKFSPQASPACPNFYSVPLSCPVVAKPVKVATSPLSVALPIGIAAVLGIGALVLAKKKGLIMAARKVAT